MGRLVNSSQLLWKKLFQKTDLINQSINSLLSNGGVSQDVIDATFSSFWPKMAKELKKISEVKIDGSVLNIANVTAAFGKYGLPEPKIGNHVYLSSGFESHNVYSSAYDLATTRIWMWGRKNRKVFDKEHKDFFDDLASRRQSGFDFRVLFLDPESSPEIISKAHKDEDFSSQLEKGIDVAQSI